MYMPMNPAYGVARRMSKLLLWQRAASDWPLPHLPMSHLQLRVDVGHGELALVTHLTEAGVTHTFGDSHLGGPMKSKGMPWRTRR